MSARFIVKLSLNCRQVLRSTIIFYLRSSLFSGKGWPLILATRSLMMRSVYYFLRLVPVLMMSSSKFKVSSLLFSMGSRRVCIRFLPR